MPILHVEHQSTQNWLIVKPALMEVGSRAFANPGVQTTSAGTRHLGSAPVTSNFVEEFVLQKVTKWISEVYLSLHVPSHMLPTVHRHMA